MKETIAQLEEEQRQRDEQHGMVTKAEKRANDMQLELEELRGKMEQVCVPNFHIFKIAMVHAIIFDINVYYKNL